MERYRTLRAYSAGGVVFRLAPLHSTTQTEIASFWATGRQNGQSEQNEQGEMLAEVALVGRSEAGIWALPKGTPQAGETIEQVAAREVQEETGLEVQLIGYIGSISYTFVREQVRYQKQVRHFLFKAIGGDLALHDSEYDRVEWFTFAEASRRMTYQNEIHILYQAEEILQRWLQHRQKEGAH